MDQYLGLRGKSFASAEHLSLLSIQGQFGVIQCVSSFDDLASTFDLNIQVSVY